jgi:hypothetical protein
MHAILSVISLIIVCCSVLLSHNSFRCHRGGALLLHWVLDRRSAEFKAEAPNSIIYVPITTTKLLKLHLIDF